MHSLYFERFWKTLIETKVVYSTENENNLFFFILHSQVIMLVIQVVKHILQKLSTKIYVTSHHADTYRLCLYSFVGKRLK